MRKQPTQAEGGSRDPRRTLRNATGDPRVAAGWGAPVRGLGESFGETTDCLAAASKARGVLGSTREGLPAGFSSPTLDQEAAVILGPAIWLDLGPGPLSGPGTGSAAAVQGPCESSWAQVQRETLRDMTAHGVRGEGREDSPGCEGQRRLASATSRPPAPTRGPHAAEVAGSSFLANRSLRIS